MPLPPTSSEIFISIFNKYFSDKFQIVDSEKIQYRVTSPKNEPISKCGYLVELIPLVPLKVPNGTTNWGSSTIIVTDDTVTITDGYLEDIIPHLNSLI